MLKTAAGLRVHPSWDLETTTTVTVLRSVARRARALAEEAAEHEKASRPSCGPGDPTCSHCAASGRSWPRPCSVPGPPRPHPLRGRLRDARRRRADPSQQRTVTNRHRLNRYGDRQLNRALHTITLSRIRYDHVTRDYVARRTSEGKTTREIKRCLKRYTARDLYRLLEHRPLTG